MTRSYNWAVTVVRFSSCTNVVSNFSNIYGKFYHISDVPPVSNDVLPVSCEESSVNGVQILQSGQKVFCEDGWTVRTVILFSALHFVANV